MSKGRCDVGPHLRFCTLHRDGAHMIQLNHMGMDFLGRWLEIAAAIVVFAPFVVADFGVEVGQCDPVDEAVFDVIAFE
ncbi:hypothetical protein KDI_00550 [Dictyobacter arantiisoli]|uniref:Uncharacterized protein n=1 Tax=Dictyobacter arantiisoli TaxID=2014874 RepID=A0A5A5T555_9CHLR|nr:hypothetical protein KDI_00550 [Dictyobacter arantiisoli]